MIFIKREYPKIHTTDVNNLFEKFKKLAKSYTPEWSFEDDFGTVLAKVYAKLLEGNFTRLNKTLHNYYLTFLNLIGTQTLPAKPAEGFVAIEVVKNTYGAYIKKGERLSAFSEIEEKEINFETKEDIFAVDSNLNSIFFVDKKSDYRYEDENIGVIVKAFDSEDLKNEEGKFKFEPFKLLDCDAFENLNKRFIYFEDNILFDTNLTEITFFFRNKYSFEKENKLFDVFSSPNSLWQYFDGLIWKKIENVTACLDKGIKISFSEKNKEFTILYGNEKKPIFKTSFFLRCSPATNSKIELTSVSYYPNDKFLFPEKLISNDEEVENSNFLPFGERIIIYNCFYIKSDEIFNKPKALIEISFNVQFAKFKSQVKNSTKNYKFLMSELDFEEINPSNSSIEKIVWEYWNNKGWTHLNCTSIIEDEQDIKEENDAYSIFKIFAGKKKITLKFFCPLDFSKVSVKAFEGYFIRARITKINNPYDLISIHILPVIDKISINSSLKQTPLRFLEIFNESKTKIQNINLENNSQITLLENIEENMPTIYLGFDKPLQGSIIRLFFDIENGFKKEEKSSFKWEYFAKNKTDGKNKWKNINIIDLTRGFFNSENVSLIGCFDFVKTNLFGKEGFFLKIINIDSKIKNLENNSFPIIHDIKLNVVKVIQKTTYEPQFFSIINGEEKKNCSLSNKNVSEVTVWVNEMDKLSTVEQEFYSNNPELVQMEFDDLGILKKNWIKWQPIENILAASHNDRVYQIDFFKSEILFGDDKNGKIPPAQYTDSIKIEYVSCDGEIGNIDKHRIGDFSSVIPNISSVDNFKSFTGGTNIETVEQAAKRMFNNICGANRIITLGDFEDSLLSNDSSIDKIKCVIHINKFSERDIACFSIAILPKIFPCGFEKFNTIKQRIFNFLKKNASASFLYGNKEISVFEVMYVKCNVTINAIIDDFNFYQDVYKDIDFKIQELLNPVKGGLMNKGWNIGQKVNENHIREKLKQIPHLKMIDNIITFNRILTKNGNEDISDEKLEKMEFTVPLFDSIDISLIV